MRWHNALTKFGCVMVGWIEMQWTWLVKSQSYDAVVMT